MVQHNRFKARLKAGEAQLGLWLSLCSPVVADAVADSGMDWVLLDMEHAANSEQTVLAQLHAGQAGCPAVVRPWWNDTVLVKRLLDMGAETLLFPMVQTPEEAAAAVAATRYPPEGVRGVSMSQRGNRYGRDAGYHGRANAEVCVLVQVETREAMARIEEIAAVDGVDGVFFGPADIAASLGRIGDLNHQAVWDEIFAAADRVLAMGVPVGTLIAVPDRVRECVDRGFTFTACGSDLNLVARGADNLVKMYKGD
ncbi:HpcH/HpaI aldolase family protein [Algicella marina]|uniref:4-hydroxy-2-oxo-heptane-1,7-dioate aldolase n=1 Tax=Algicella marina TaxID=2683284 RepID=A0A6P1SXX1_9RHOB|nr:HpcH/HpaI aldolase/citrate lyase family protein [Algicella marina]QHQ34331.1 4-hydroxy-2-oxo-heptane-1,7-dioate aldolase [Algicella marina]